MNACCLMSCPHVLLQNILPGALMYPILVAACLWVFLHLVLYFISEIHSLLG